MYSLSFVPHILTIFVCSFAVSQSDFGDFDEFRRPIFQDDDTPSAPLQEEEIPLDDSPSWFRTRRQDNKRAYYTDRDIFGTKSSGGQYIQGPSVQPSRPMYQQPYQPRMPIRNNDDQCKCDLEYILKYKSSSQPGNYHVKVFHEETGQYQSEPETYVKPMPRYPPPGNGWPARKIYTEDRTQPQDRGRYYEEVEQVGDRLYSTGGKQSVPPRVREEIIYKPRNARAPRKSPAKTARAIVHKARWASLGLMSDTDSETSGYPMLEIVRISDLKNDKSSGVPLFYISQEILDSAENIEEQKVTLRISLQNEDSDANCEEDGDQPDWKCITVVLFGKLNLITSTEEMDLAAESISTKHPNFTFTKDGVFASMKIRKISLSGRKSTVVSLQDY